MLTDKTRNLINLINEINKESILGLEKNDKFSFLQLKVKDSKPNIKFYYNFIEDIKNEVLLLVSYTENLENNSSLRIEQVTFFNKSNNPDLFSFYEAYKDSKEFKLDDLYNNVTKFNGFDISNQRTLEHLLSKVLMSYSEESENEIISNFGK